MNSLKNGACSKAGSILFIFLSNFVVVSEAQTNEFPEQTNHQCHNSLTLKCEQPAFLNQGDRVALISPSYFTPMENVEKTAELLRSWGLEPVVGPNVGKVSDVGKYAGTLEERISDIRWALNDKSIKAILCNRGGYGAIHLINNIDLTEFKTSPKWLIGYSDITTIHEMEQCAGVMSIHGTMSSSLAKNGTDSTSTLLRDLLFGKVPSYDLPSHPQNIEGSATGTLVGGNLMTLSPLVGSSADVTRYKDFILFIEEIEESMHNIDRQFNMLKLTGALERCRGIILGEFTDCACEYAYENVEQMLRQYFLPYNIPVLCGFPAGHGDVNLPLIMGAPVTIDVRPDGATVKFNIAAQ